MLLVVAIGLPTFEMERGINPTRFKLRFAPNDFLWQEKNRYGALAFFARGCAAR